MSSGRSLTFLQNFTSAYPESRFPFTFGPKRSHKVLPNAVSFIAGVITLIQISPSIVLLLISRGPAPKNLTSVANSRYVSPNNIDKDRESFNR